MFDAFVEDIGAGPVDLIDVVRLGAKSSNKLRPLRVQFNNLGHRRSVLANAKRLRDSSSDVFKGIYINPNLSVKDIQEQRKLREELNRRKENGETNIFICRGHIVKQRSLSNPGESTLESIADQSG